MARNAPRPTPIGVPDAFGWGLKQIAKALSDYAPDYKVEWPQELGVGLAAMVMGIEAYRSDKPQETPEKKMLTAYLESDVFALQVGSALAARKRGQA